MVLEISTVVSFWRRAAAIGKGTGNFLGEGNVLCLGGLVFLVYAFVKAHQTVH